MRKLLQKTFCIEMSPPLNGGKIKIRTSIYTKFHEKSAYSFDPVVKKKQRELFMRLAGGSRQSHGLFVLKKQGHM